MDHARSSQHVNSASAGWRRAAGAAALALCLSACVTIDSPSAQSQPPISPVLQAVGQKHGINPAFLKDTYGYSLRQYDMVLRSKEGKEDAEFRSIMLFNRNQLAAGLNLGDVQPAMDAYGVTQKDYFAMAQAAREEGNLADAAAIERTASSFKPATPSFRIYSAGAASGSRPKTSVAAAPPRSHSKSPDAELQRAVGQIQYRKEN